VDRIERLRQQRQAETTSGVNEENPAVRSVQELGRDSNSVF
jgi:hypothetical protein